MQPKIIYSPNYNIHFFGLEKLHAFDSCKYGRAWQRLEGTFGIDKLNNWKVKPMYPVEESLLSIVHTEDYLKLLNNSNYVMQLLEMPLLGWFVPIERLRKHVLEPMRLAVTGTIIASEEALNSGIAVNLSGGYHHASKSHGGGFCIYSDIAVAISKLRQSNEITNNDQIIIIDLDAHQGNGLERIFYEDKNVYFLDMYNQNTYPNDEWAKQRINYNIPLHTGTTDEEYLGKLRKQLPLLLQEVRNPKIAFYNAGTDIYKNDSLGGLQISEQGILERDKLVFKTLIDANIPLIMLPSGGYSKMSHILIANSIKYILENWG
jgi:histone deacetylase 11